MYMNVIDPIPGEGCLSKQNIAQKWILIASMKKPLTKSDPLLQINY